eukprot:994687-Rhodomonas_salina.2
MQPVADFTATRASRNAVSPAARTVTPTKIPRTQTEAAGILILDGPSDAKTTPRQRLALCDAPS